MNSVANNMKTQNGISKTNGSANNGFNNGVEFEDEEKNRYVFYFRIIYCLITYIFV